jgi:hypothetical protein
MTEIKLVYILLVFSGNEWQYKTYFHVMNNTHDSCIICEKEPTNKIRMDKKYSKKLIKSQMGLTLSNKLT